MFKKIWIRVLIGLFGVTASSVLAATYYVSTSGLDTNPGTLSYPFETIQKAASVMTAGDTCYIRGGIYREKVTVTVSGTTNSPITFQPYNNEDVTITGTENITGWTDDGGNIHYAPVTLTLANRNQVFVNWDMVPLARWPNAGAEFPWQDSSTNPSSDWSYVDSASYVNDYGQFTDAELPSRPDDYWNGCTVNIMSGYGWIMETPAVTDYDSSSKRIYTNLPTYANAALTQYHDIMEGNEYYLSGKKEEMDSSGEWFYDSVAERLYIYSTSSPTGVEAKQRLYGFNLSGVSNIKLVDLNFFACTIQTDSESSYNTFDGLNMKYLAHSVTHVADRGLYLRTGDVLRNSELAYASRGLVSLSGDDIRIINCHLHDSGYVPMWTALLAGSGYRHLISHNTLHDAGRAVMGSFGKSSIAEYNDMYNGMKLTSDGGIFYTYGDAANSVFRYNMLHDSSGPQGHEGAGVLGFYLDFYSSNWIVHNNIIWNVPGRAIFASIRQSFNMFFNNTCWDSDGSMELNTCDGTDSGTHILNNFVSDQIEYRYKVDMGSSDIRFNMLSSSADFVNSAGDDFRLEYDSLAVDQGTIIPGVTDVYVGDAPDIGALEYNGTDWTAVCGHSATPPSPDPTYTAPNIIFCNKVTDGGFESGGLSNWTLVPDSSVSMLQGAATGTGYQPRIGSYALQFDTGTSEVYQTVTGLLPGQKYKLYGGINLANASAVVKLGVRNYGRESNAEITASYDSDWVFYNLSFVTGPTSTTAEIYVSGTVPAGNPIYVDDIGLEMDINSSKSEAGMPIIHYSFDEDDGLVAYDQTPNDLDGTLQNMSVSDWVAGQYNNALDFDGTDDYVQVGNDEELFVNSGDFTISYWAKLTYRESDSTTYPVVALYEDASNFMYLGFNGAGSTRCYSKTDGTDSFSISTSAQGWNVWKHYTWVYSCGSFTLYINGIVAGQEFGLVFDGQPTVRIGSRIGSCFFKGAVDDFRMYNYALLPNEINEIMNLDLNKAAHYRLDESPGSTKAWDCSGNGADGFLHDMDEENDWSYGRVGGALNFDGIDDYIYVGNNDSLFVNSGNFTVSYWAKLASRDSDTTTYPVVSLYENSSNFMYLGFTGARTIRCFSKTDGTDQFAISASGPSWDKWNHYTWVYSSGNLKLYLNGSLITQSSGTIFDGQPALRICSRVGSNYFFKGAVDDIRIYSCALSESQITAIADVDFSKAAHYRFDENSGAGKAWDCSGNGEDGILYHMDTATDWISGQNGGALDFDGTDDYVYIGNDDNLFVNSGDFTISYWAKLTYRQSDYVTYPVVSLYENSNNFIYLGFNGAKAIRCFARTDGTDVLTVNTAGPGWDDWKHYTWVYSSGNLKLYVNGSFVTQSSGTIFDGQPTIRVGTRMGTTYFFKGAVDELRIDRGAMDAATVMELYQESF